MCKSAIKKNVMPRNAITPKSTTEPPPAWAAQLTPREQKFVSEYIIDLDATDAAVRAGLGKTRKSSTEIASRLRRKDSVAQAISVLIAQRSGVTSSRIIEELGKLAFADVTDIVKVKNGQIVVADTDDLSPDQRASIAEISETLGEGGRTIKVKLHDKLNARDKLAKVLSLYKERVEVTQTYDPNTLESARKRVIDRMESMLRRMDGGGESRAEIEPPLARIAPSPLKSVRIIDAE
jgi:phage terminase small subunit